MPILQDAFVALHAEGAQLAPEMESQALAATVAAEATIAEGLAAGGTAGGAAAGEALAVGITEGATAGTVAGGERLVQGMDAATLAAVSQMVEALTAGGAAGGAAAGEGIAAGLRAGAASGAKAVAAEVQSAGLAASGTFGAGFAKATPQVLAAVVGIALLVKGLKSATESAEEAEAAEEKLRATLSTNQLAASVSSRAFHDQAAAIQDLTGFQDEQVEGAQAQLALFNLTGEQIKTIIPLTADYARRTGKDMPEAAGLLGRALLGNARALKAVGINFTATGDRAADFEAIVALLEQRVGGFATEGVPQLARQTAILEANWDDLKETLGEVAVPVLTQVARGANFVLETVTASNEEVQRMGPVATAVRGSLNALSTGFQALGITADFFNRTQVEQDSILDAGLVKLGNYANQLSLGDINARQYREATDTVIDGLAAEGAEEGKVNQLREGAQAILDAYKLNLLGVAHAHEIAGAEARLHLAAELALTGGLLGIASAADSAAGADDDLAAARAKVRQITQNGNRDTKAGQQAVEDYSDAVLQDATAHANLVGVIAKYRTEAKEAGQSTKDVSAALRDQLSQSGLTRAEIDRLIARTQAKIDADKNVEQNIVQHWRTEGLDESTDKASKYAGIIDAIQKTAPITVHYKTTMTQGGTGPGFGPTPSPTPSPGPTPTPSPQPGGGGGPRGTPTVVMPQVNVIMDGRVIERQREERRLLLGGG